MNIKIQNHLVNLKSQCKTASQRKAFNQIIKSFSTSDSLVRKTLRGSKIKFDKVYDWEDEYGKDGQGYATVEVEGLSMDIINGLDYSLLVVLNEPDGGGYDYDAEVNARHIHAANFDEQLLEFIKMVKRYK